MTRILRDPWLGCREEGVIRSRVVQNTEWLGYNSYLCNSVDKRAAF